MPKSFLIKRRRSAELGTRNWGELSDRLRGDSYVPETRAVPALVHPTILSLSSRSEWIGRDPHHLVQNPLYLPSPAVGKHLPQNKSGSVSCATPPSSLQGRGLPLQVGFQCSVCSKRFPLQRMLNRHSKSHSPVKKHLCHYCSKGFNDTFDLKRHLRTHTGIRPYRCCLCDKGFTQRCSLESHLKKIHCVPQTYGYRERREKLFVCEHCGFTCGTSDEYYRHTRRGHSAGLHLGEDFPKPGPAAFLPQLHLLLG
ncbi:putative transcription factor ovo-like protein 3 [Ahaetulla prasina]|uniref:putative transcription factor ovo-like protein 3 n=1 Tax=Ahaetulla prasina TaxID=499056 RepID=UPI002647C7E4|nr:putative transcription factor ovo-like protein 3 [Ahaetulla prasina]